MPYPNPLDDPFDTSPQLVCLWARRVVIILELPEIDEAIEAAKKDKDADAQKFYENLKKEAEEELSIIESKFDEIKSHMD